MTRVLLTGFEPFDGARVNPSWEVAELLADEGIGLPGVEVAAVRLPVVFSRVRGLLAAALERDAPDVVIGLGLAAGRPHVSVERVGINLAVARIPDNEGDRPRDVPLAPGRPDAHLATLPVGELLAGDPRLLDSLSAGAYVCNAVLFHLLDLVALVAPGTERVRAAGFLHVPATGPDALASHDEVGTGGGAGGSVGTEGAGADVPQVPLRDVADVVAGAVRLTLEARAGSAASGQPDG
ncbi:pyroglutamyl-peptidase I [Salana multivorans]|uniref:Pyroglutamyl-peptidase I n=1 Tax=Salana multivorans TaxID=120377 RepID=A0A3N2D1W3_9MICO|nr:pyroglutamyl-peptidase I [Salana multivorans]ROR93454.1 pyroglutamyl-peptidase I [Salana multivorans]